MNSHHLIAISLAVALAGTVSANYGFCQNPPADSPQTNAPAAPAPAVNAPIAPVASAMVVPAETTIPLRLMNTINSRTAQPGQALYCETIFPITAGNKVVIPRGSSVKGSITQVIRPKRGKHKQAQMGLRFETLILPNGTTIALRAALSGFGTAGNEGFQPKEAKIEGASTKGEDAGKVATTTVTGAELGTIVGAAEGSVWKGLGIGSLAGAGGGLVWILASRGKEIVLPSGTNFDLRLSAPLTFNPDDLSAPSAFDQGQAPPQ